MSELIVLGFKDRATADNVVPELQTLQSEGLLQLSDWARAIRNQDGKIDMRQGTSTTGIGAAGGALWGMLVGLLFLMPLAGLALGAASGAVMGKLTDVGIDDKFIKDVSKQITRHLGLSLYVEQATTDRVVERLKQYRPAIIRTSLSRTAEEQLRAAMQGESADITGRQRSPSSVTTLSCHSSTGPRIDGVDVDPISPATTTATASASVPTPEVARRPTGTWPRSMV